MSRAKQLYPQVYKGVRWNTQENMFTFPSGARIEFGYLRTEEDVEQYRGQEYTWLGIDEITQIPKEEWYDKLKSSLRSTDKQQPLYVRATTNPSGAGVGWVKDRWINRGPQDTRIVDTYMVKGFGEVELTKRWFHSTIYDNKTMMETDPAYVAGLMDIQNTALREQWLTGSWDAVEGAAFTEFRRDIHVIEPFPISGEWFKIRTCDWGYSALAVVLWLAVDYDNNVYIYREFCANGPACDKQGIPRLTADKFALKVLEQEYQDHRIDRKVIDSSTFAKRGESIDGDSIADIMNQYGCNWTPSDRSPGSRINGKLLIHKYLQHDEDNPPKLFIFNTCTQIINELAQIQLDKSNSEDVETKNQDDHAYDALRYGLSLVPGTGGALNRRGPFINRKEGPYIVNPRIGY